MNDLQIERLVAALERIEDRLGSIEDAMRSYTEMWRNELEPEAWVAPPNVVRKKHD